MPAILENMLDTNIWGAMINYYQKVLVGAFYFFKGGTT
jgi:hypothetical protein